MNFEPHLGLHILQHSLGVDEYGRGASYRNHFVTGEGSTDHPTCVALTADGLMTRRAGNELSGGDDVFRVTDAGVRYVAQNSPAPPKRSRSQRRYEAWCREDSDLPFGAWLKRRGATA